MIFDTHAHYDDEQFDTDREALLASLSLSAKKGPYGVVTHVCDATASVESLHKVMDLDKSYDNMYCTIGIHPDEVGDITDEVWEDIRTLARDPKCVAIGEIGLDYYWDKEGHDLQEKWFRAQIELALELGKPINVHSREACEDTMRIIREYYGKGWNKDFHPGIIHCFSYSPEIAELYVQMGFAIGVGGVVTYKNGRKLKEVVQRIPLEHIVLETDCPYLSPTPNRGKRNSSL
ncbi:MAG: TatD family hydrolase, partial [Lachnospiraceae bacterium]|nr:TatD family hydrolase [Candidatus Equihabitans merdae]